MRWVLIGLFSAIFLGMLGVTIYASLERGVFEAGYLFQERWFVATLVDAYLGFLTFYVWLAWRETGWTARIVWLILILCFGNMAMSLYVLIQLFRLRPGEPLETVLLGTRQPPPER